MFNKGNKIAGQPHSISINFIYDAKMGLYPKSSNINEITSHIGVTNTEINKMSVQRQIPRSSRQHFASMFNSYRFRCGAVLFILFFCAFLCIFLRLPLSLLHRCRVCLPIAFSAPEIETASLKKHMAKKEVTAKAFNSKWE